MGSNSVLEQRLIDLIGDYSKLKEVRSRLEAELADREERIGELGVTCERLKLQIDELGQNRFALKQMREERKLIRRRLEQAVARLAALEQELLS